MVDLVGARTELRRAGPGQWKGICPFHEERTPSFSVDADRKLYHCFGCGVGGDAFDFVRETEGLDFVGAMEHLAGRYGVQLEVADEDPQAAERRRRRERLLELLERAAAFYVRYLWDSQEAEPARRYLADRGLGEGRLREFRVGYSPSAWDTLLLAGRRQGFGNKELYDAGLAVRAKGEGRIYDRFRRRIMFPLCDQRGHVLGFGARALGAGQQPKYLNSSDNDVFHKGEHVFAGDLARVHATKAGSVIVAEGYTDVIALHQAGLRNTVGIMGTALTEKQVGALARLAPTALLALDADSAGQEAMVRAAKLAQGRVELRVVPLPPGTDPADLVQRDGAAAARRLVESSIPFVRFQVERELGSGDTASAEGKDRVIGALRPVFATLPPSAVREELLAHVADRLDLAPSLVSSWLSSAGAGGSGPPSRAAQRAERAGNGAPMTTTTPLVRAERGLLAQSIALPDVGREKLAAIDVAVFSSEPLRRAAAHLRDHIRDPLEAVPDDDRELRSVLVGLMAEAERMPASRAALEAQLVQVEIEALREQMRAAERGRTGGMSAMRSKLDLLSARRDQYLGSAMEESSPVE